MFEVVFSLLTYGLHLDGEMPLSRGVSAGHSPEPGDQCHQTRTLLHPAQSLIAASVQARCHFSRKFIYIFLKGQLSDNLVFRETFFSVQNSFCLAALQPNGGIWMSYKAVFLGSVENLV